MWKYEYLTSWSFQAITRISTKYPDFVGAVIAVNKTGQEAAACHGIGNL